jgi:3-hydroxybutyryl-CoA dehydrogenase
MQEERLEDYALNRSAKKQSGGIKAGLVGCGSMGQEIAILISKSGIDVTFVEVSEKRIANAIMKMEEQIEIAISHWGMTYSDKRAIMSRIKGTTNYEDLADCNIVIEAINTAKWVPNQPTRRKVFREIEKVVSKDCVIVSNASTIVIADLATELKYPCRSIGMHFISPVLTTKIIEVNRCINTSESTVRFIQRFVRMIGKEIIKIYGSPGNISTRLIAPMINEACELLMEGVSTVEDIDKTMKIGYGMLRGPFTMADRIGLDKLTKWMEGLYNEYGDPRYKTSPLIRRMVRAGMLGMKSGEGFYMYENGKKQPKSGSVFNLGHEQKLF